MESLQQAAYKPIVEKETKAEDEVAVGQPEEPRTRDSVCTSLERELERWLRFDLMEMSGTLRSGILNDGIASRSQLAAMRATRGQIMAADPTEDDAFRLHDPCPALPVHDPVVHIDDAITIDVVKQARDTSHHVRHMWR